MVQVSIERHCQRTWNRRRGHHQKVGRVALGAELGPLQDAETMLLVDHDQTQRPKSYALLDERVRTDDQADLTRGDGFQKIVSLTLLERRGQKSDPIPGSTQNPRDVREMLLRQHLGGNHERDLRPVFHHDHRRQDGDNRLSRADVALQQPLHRARRRQLLGDGLQDCSLSVRQTKR
jgi:hypothetical protein